MANELIGQVMAKIKLRAATPPYGVCFGPHALTPGFMESLNRRAFVDQIPLIIIIVTLFSVPRESLLIKSKKI